MHFLPTVLQFEENYGRTAFRTSDWDQGLAQLDGQLGAIVCAIFVPVATLACLAGLFGVRPRLTAGLAGISWYVVASVNSVHTQTLALVSLWALLSLWAIVGEGGAPAALWPGHLVASRSSILAWLIALYLLGTVFFSGIAKIASGWPLSGSWSRLSRYPAGGVIRDWFVGAQVDAQQGFVLEICTIVLELGLPALILTRRFRRTATCCYVALFTCMFMVFELPPLFGVLFIGGAIVFAELPSMSEFFHNLMHPSGDPSEKVSS